MPRPWIEFIQSQKLPWQGAPLAGLRPGVEAKVLSEDSETGALSLLTRYPRGFRLAPSRLAVDNELLVLQGELAIGSRHHGRLGYAHLPAGFQADGEWRSEAGAVVLEFFSAAPAAEGGDPGFDPQRLVIGLDGLGVPYTGNFHPEFPPGAGRKTLYTDPASGDATWLLGTLPLRWAERAEVHPTVEEMFLLAGEVHGNRGVMRPGAYFWRPANEFHGPYGTLTGNLYFFRTKGGGLSTEYVEPERPFRWDPEYDPILPASLADYAGEVPSGVLRW